MASPLCHCAFCIENDLLRCKMCIQNPFAGIVMNTVSHHGLHFVFILFISCMCCWSKHLKSFTLKCPNSCKWMPSNVICRKWYWSKCESMCILRPHFFIKPKLSASTYFHLLYCVHPWPDYVGQIRGFVVEISTVEKSTYLL